MRSSCATRDCRRRSLCEWVKAGTNEQRAYLRGFRFWKLDARGARAVVSLAIGLWCTSRAPRSKKHAERTPFARSASLNSHNERRLRAACGAHCTSRSLISALVHDERRQCAPRLREPPSAGTSERHAMLCEAQAASCRRSSGMQASARAYERGAACLCCCEAQGLVAVLCARK